VSRLYSRWLVSGRGWLTAVIALVALSGFPRAATAEARDPRPSPLPFSLTVSPARLVIPSGETEQTQMLNVSNTGAQPLHVVVGLAEFSQTPDGKITFRPPGPLSAATWVQVSPTSFDLSPGDRQAVEVKISIPNDPEPGERQVGLTFLVPAEQSQSNIALNRGIGVPLLIQVPGIVVQRIEFDSLSGPWLATGGSVPVRLTIRNLGNVHRDYIQPDNLLATASSGDQISFPSFTVLRESTRVVEAKWTDPPLFCICRISVRGDDGRGHEIITGVRIIVFPLWQVLGILLASIGLFLLARDRRKRRHRRVAAALADLRAQSQDWRRRLGEAETASRNERSPADRSQPH
jgi:hypothetical protein